MIDWIKNNWADMWLIISTAVTLASVIVKLTPSKEDDKWLMRIIKIISLYKKPTADKLIME